MTGYTDAIRSALYPFLIGVSALLLALFVELLLQRAYLMLRARRRSALKLEYQPLVDALLSPGAKSMDLGMRLTAIPARHHEIVCEMLLAPLAISSGQVVTSVRWACAALDMDRRWREALKARQWWRRADAARALGLIRDTVSVPALISLLEDDHDEVRAAAVDSLAAVREPEALAALVPLLSSPSKHQRARVVEALRRQGTAAVPVLLDRARSSPGDALTIVELLGLIRAQSAADDLVAWAGAETAPLRAAAVVALGAIGLDERTYYYVLKALGDASADVRAAAARAIGRSGRQDAGAYLEPLLDDEWIVAANAATSLRAMGTTGVVAFQRRAAEESQAGELARQMLWERRTFTGTRS